MCIRCRSLRERGTRKRKNSHSSGSSRERVGNCSREQIRPGRPSYVGNGKHIRNRGEHKRLRRQSTEVIFVCSRLSRRDALAGALDTDFFAYLDDLDLAFRVQPAWLQWIVHCRRCSIPCHFSASIAGAIRDARHMLQKHRGLMEKCTIDDEELLARTKMPERQLYRRRSSLPPTKRSFLLRVYFTVFRP